MQKINFLNTYIDETALKNVTETIASTFVSEGKVVKEFEGRLEQELGLNNLFTVNSGTSALHLSLVLAGVSHGDEVIIPAQTFIATGLAVLMQRAIPVFADIDYSDGNIDPVSIEKLITSKTKAIIPVHWAGRPCRMDEITAIAKKNNIAVIEDAAHALGATYKGQNIGNISEYTCFSFQAIKHLTTGDGGAITCNNKEKYLEGKRRRWFGLDRLNSKVSSLGERDCDVTELGFKYHLNDLSASLGLANLPGLKKRLSKRAAIVEKYDEAVRENAYLTNLNRSDDVCTSAHWLYGILASNREEFIAYMKEKEIPVSVVHQGIDRFSIFKDFKRELPIQRKFDENQIHLPLHDSLDDKQVEYIAKAISEFKK
jgi:perosamine synthetase